MFKYLNHGVCLNFEFITFLFTLYPLYSVTRHKCNSFYFHAELLLFFTPPHRLWLLLDGGFLLGPVGGRPFTGRTGEQDKVIFGLRDLQMNKCSVSVEQVRTVIM